MSCDRGMITRFPADEPVALQPVGRDDHDSALLKRIPGDARLPESLPPWL